MTAEIKINTYFSLWGPISIEEGESHGVQVKQELQKQEIIRKTEFGIETRRHVNVDRKRQLPDKKSCALLEAEEMKQ